MTAYDSLVTVHGAARGRAGARTLLLKYSDGAGGGVETGTAEGTIIVGSRVRVRDGLKQRDAGVVGVMMRMARARRACVIEGNLSKTIHAN